MYFILSYLEQKIKMYPEGRQTCLVEFRYNPKFGRRLWECVCETVSRASGTQD